MNTGWKDKGKGIGKSGDLLLTRRNERRYAEREVQNITVGMHGVNVNSIQKGTSLRDFTKKYSSYLSSFYNK